MQPSELHRLKVGTSSILSCTRRRTEMLWPDDKHECFLNLKPVIESHECVSAMLSRPHHGVALLRKGSVQCCSTTLPTS